MLPLGRWYTKHLYTAQTDTQDFQVKPQSATSGGISILDNNEPCWSSGNAVAESESPGWSVKELGALDDDKVCRGVDSPC